MMPKPGNRADQRRFAVAGRRADHQAVAGLEGKVEAFEQGPAVRQPDVQVLDVEAAGLLFVPDLGRDLDVIQARLETDQSVDHRLPFRQLREHAHQVGDGRVHFAEGRAYLGQAAEGKAPAKNCGAMMNIGMTVALRK